MVKRHVMMRWCTLLLQLCKNGTMRPVIAVAGIDQMFQGHVHFTHEADLIFQFRKMGKGQLLHITAGALAVLPQFQQLLDARRECRSHSGGIGGVELNPSDLCTAVAFLGRRCFDGECWHSTNWHLNDDRCPETRYCSGRAIRSRLFIF